MDAIANDVMQGWTLDWGAFLQLFPITLIGLAIHVLSKLKSAKSKPGFTMPLFWKLNYLSYVIAFLFCIIGLIWISAGIILLPSVAPWIVAFVIGVGGGSLVRKFVNSKAPDDDPFDADSDV